MLKGTTIVLGVTGSIAAYKSIYLTRLLIEQGATILPVLTRSACRFVGALSFSTLSKTRAVTDLWTSAHAGEIGHVQWAHQADLLVIAPATANTIAHLALGQANNPLTAIALATPAPILVGPAMEDGMWNNPATVEHMEILKNRGVIIAPPQPGKLASGRQGEGRMAEPEVLLEMINTTLTPKDLEGLNICVTAGPTQEAIDPVRYLTNYSTGKMGYAIARSAQARGANVTLVSGPTHLSPIPGVTTISVKTTIDMLQVCKKVIPNSNALIMAAAPADFRPTENHSEKLKKAANLNSLQLDSNPDILTTTIALRNNCITVGFAAESNDILTNALDKLTRKQLDMIVANDIGAEGSGFGTDTNKVTILKQYGDKIELPQLNKHAVANAILDEILVHKRA